MKLILNAKYYLGLILSIYLTETCTEILVQLNLILYIFIHNEENSLYVIFHEFKSLRFVQLPSTSPRKGSRRSWLCDLSSTQDTSTQRRISKEELLSPAIFPKVLYDKPKFVARCWCKKDGKFTTRHVSRITNHWRTRSVLSIFFCTTACLSSVLVPA